MELEKECYKKLHLGCGKLKLEGFINIDLDESADIVHDIKNLKIFEDDSISEIYASHCLEHFSRREIINILLEWKRVLKVGGILRIAVPDLEAVINLYNRDPENIYLIFGLLYGGQTNELDYHKFGFTFTTLSDTLASLGFESIKRYDTWEFLGEDLDDYSKSYLPHMDRNGTLVSLNIKCKKGINDVYISPRLASMFKLYAPHTSNCMG